MTGRTNETAVDADESKRRQLRRADPRYCNQWNTPPTRYGNEETGTVLLQAMCGLPSQWEVHAFGTRDYACDAHLAQAVRSMSELEMISVVDVVPRDPDRRNPPF